MNTHAAQDRSSAAHRGRGKQQEPPTARQERKALEGYSMFLFEPAGTQGCWFQPADTCGSNICLDLFIGTSPNQSPVSRLPPLRLRLCGRTPCSSRPDRSRLREEPELKSPQLRRWRLSRPDCPHGLLRTWKGTQETVLGMGQPKAPSFPSDVFPAPQRLPAYVHGLQFLRDLGTSWTAGGNE